MHEGASPLTGSTSTGVTPVQSLVRGLAVITVFDQEHSHLTLSEVARSASLSRATARRVLHTLVDLGYVGMDGSKFHLRPAILELGHSYLSSLGLPAVAQPHLESLTDRVHESSSVAVMDEEDIVYVARVATRKLMTVTIHVGTRFPAHLTSMGRVLLAALPEAELAPLLAGVDWTPATDHTVSDEAALRKILSKVSAQGYALVDQELELGLRSVAAPIHDRHGRVVAAMNISTSASHHSVKHIKENLLPALLEAAGAVGAELAMMH